VTKIVNAADIEAAEKLLGVNFTPAERALMLDNFAPQIEQALRRRAVTLTTPPASKFDPRLPGFEMPQPAPAFALPAAGPLPQTDEDIAFAAVTELAGWLRAGALTAVRLTEIYLARIARLNPVLFCYATVTADSALARAAELDSLSATGSWLSPLHGIPYGMKDIVDTAGVETAWGAEPFQGRVPESDAHVTAALHAAGAILLGKTTVGALAYGDLWYGGRTRNPWNVEEGSSGSSAGSASAVAAGLAGFAIGTETLGSIVCPSTRCGAVGLRPSFGRVSRRGAMPLAWSLDKIGPICRTVEDTGLVLAEIGTPDPADPFQIAAPAVGMAKLNGIRLGYFPDDFANRNAIPLDSAALETARSLGFEMVPLTRRALPYQALMAILYAESAAAFEDLTLSNRDDLLTWQESDAWPNSFRKARFLSAVDHVQLDRLRRMVMQEMDAVFANVDVIIGPSEAGPMLVITNFTGHPCLCIPSGFRDTQTRGAVSLAGTKQAPAGPAHRVPHSISLWGRLFDESRLLAAGRALEALLGVTSRPVMPAEAGIHDLPGG
jgi:Asp-tRNA(Asn)/Glu-tRNA(Gln) amidotransferase A subunit family amidase